MTAYSPGAAMVAQNITRFPIDGFTISNAADTVNDLTIAAGAAGATNSPVIIATSSAMTKRADATWAAGTNAGGMFNGVSFSMTSTYHIFAIKKDSDGSVDFGFDTSLTAANRPAGYTAYRMIGSLCTIVGSAAWHQFLQVGNQFNLKDPVLCGSSTLQNVSALVVLVGIPTGIAMPVGLVARCTRAGATAGIYITSPFQTDDAMSETNLFQSMYAVGSGSTTRTVAVIERICDTSAQVRYVADAASNTTASIKAHYYRHPRGANA